MQSAKKWRRMVRRVLRRDPPDTPDSLLQQAETELREAQARHRQRAVTVVTSKNNLQQQVNDLQARVENFGAKATIAADRNDDDLAQQMRSEGEHHEKLLASMQEKMVQVETINQLVKETYYLQNEILHQRIAEILALKVQYQTSVLQKGMVDALLGEAHDTPAQRRAREKARQIVLLDSQKREKEFAVLVEAAEKEVAGLRLQAGRAHTKNDEAAERVLAGELDDEERTLSLLRDAHDRARDVCERAERWAGVVAKDTPTEKENV